MMMFASVKPRWENRNPMAVLTSIEDRKIAPSLSRCFRSRSWCRLAIYTFVP